MLSREDGRILGSALDFEDECQSKKGRLMRTWKMQVEEESMKVGLRRKDALCRSKWSVGINKIAAVFCICVVVEISSLLIKNCPGFSCACVMDNLIS